MIRKVQVMLPTIIATRFLSQMREKVERASVYQKQSIHDTSSSDWFTLEKAEQAGNFPGQSQTI